ncbi:MAG TPA: WHG domain-containing protein [Micromonosporaceae bacterium]|jgi:AcrR family transcriptional regulator
MTRPSYHHGDLANALTAAATQLARDGGPDAVVLREAARKVGVSATAAYRHFASHGELIHAVKHVAADRLAERMKIELARTQPLPDPGPEAVRRLRALGNGYLRFAVDEPGLFRTAFCNPAAAQVATVEIMSVEHALDMALVDPFRMLMETVEELARTGMLAPERRPWAEIFAWSAVHGLAMLLLDGPLQACSPDEREQVIARVLDGVADGLVPPSPGPRA